MERGELLAARARWKAEGRSVVFTNGCFDILHDGHRLYLDQAAREGDILVVGVNSDFSVQALKGPSRPVYPELARAAAVAALPGVDAVSIFDEVQVSELVRLLLPDLYVKGGDYTPDSIDPGLRKVLDQEGIALRILGLVPGVSTTAILESRKQVATQD